MCSDTDAGAGEALACRDEACTTRRRKYMCRVRNEIRLKIRVGAAIVCASASPHTPPKPLPRAMSAIPKSVVLVSSAVMWDALRAHDSQRVARNSGGPRSARGQATGSVAFSKGFGRSVSAAHSLSAHGLVGKSLVIARGAKGKGVTLGGGAAAVSLGRRKGAHEKVRRGCCCARRRVSPPPRCSPVPLRDKPPFSTLRTSARPADHCRGDVGGPPRHGARCARPVCAADGGGGHGGRRHAHGRAQGAAGQAEGGARAEAGRVRDLKRARLFFDIVHRGRPSAHHVVCIHH